MSQPTALTWKEARARAQARGCKGFCVCRECCIDEALQSVSGTVPTGARSGGPRPTALPPLSRQRHPRGWKAPSEKQTDLIGRLFDEREFRSLRSRQAFAEATYEEDFGSRDASAHIDTLMALPRAGTRERKARQEAENSRIEQELEAGSLYAHDHPHRKDLGDVEIYRVQRSKTSKKLYALRVLEGGGTEYAPGMVTRLDPARKLTLEEAQAWGRKTGTCCNCYAELTNPESVERGLGPVCAGRI